MAGNERGTDNKRRTRWVPEARDKFGCFRFLGVLEIGCFCNDTWREFCEINNWSKKVHGS